jgi:hypothetical protein
MDISPKVFIQKKTGVIGTYSDIGTLGDMGTSRNLAEIVKLQKFDDIGQFGDMGPSPEVNNFRKLSDSKIK